VKAARKKGKRKIRDLVGLYQKIVQFRQEYYNAGRHREFEEIVKIARKGAELLFPFSEQVWMTLN